MKINIIIVGKTKEYYIQHAINEYMKRINRYAQLNWIIVKEEKISKNTKTLYPP